MVVLVLPMIAASLVVGAPRSLASAKEPSIGRLSVLRDAERPSDPTGELSGRASSYVCPSDMAMVGQGFCIDRYEASLVQVCEDGSEQPWPYYATLPAHVVVRAVSSAGVFPQGYVSGVQAQAACQRSGKRLCKAQEWRTACMGPKKTVFPYGDKRQVGRCNDNGRSAMHFFNPQLDDKPEHLWMWGHAGNMIDPRLNQLTGTLTRTGERSDCTNDYGVFDMVGNLHEWVDDPDGTFQGGYYLDTHLNGDGCYYRTTAHPMSHYDYSTGFRCCADVDEP
jgi:formylglycine-generating enzyme